jgi:amino acid adenylation domain-containing protein
VTDRYGLAGLLEASARRDPDHAAVGVPGGRRITYGELDALSNAMRDRLVHLGVGPGDRVGMRLHKSIDGVVTLFGALKAGAAYVPVDAESPAARGAYIHNDCQVKVVVTERKLEAAFVEQLSALGASPVVIALDEDASDLPIRVRLAELQASDPAPETATAAVGPDDIAYLLYTSGSTGKPKGVVLTHENALSFVDWCSDTFGPSADDVFSSHAPFHFDLSILDLYVPLKHGATLVLFGEALGKDPIRLAATIASERISVWYSTPSILSLLALYGKLDRYDYSPLRIVNFAGEVFPVPQFKTVQAIWSTPQYYNLYGPTETNVCTAYAVPRDDSWKTMDTFPIGTICVPNLGRVVDEQGNDVPTGEPGELVVHGPNVMKGYWNLPEQNAAAFLVDAEGRRWYHTGDIVTEHPGGEYIYRGRRDRMVKRRGYRVELGEIEAALARHPDIREVAVVSAPDKDSGVKVAAFVSCQEGRTLTIVALKQASAQVLPPYMIPDVFSVVDALPRTSTNKIDLQALKARV